jgi:hypothetical protein
MGNNSPEDWDWDRFDMMWWGVCFGERCKHAGDAKVLEAELIQAWIAVAQQGKRLPNTP